MNTLNRPLPVTELGLTREKIKVLALLKKGVWLYFLLLIFEGALRKWFLPFLSSPLLIIRDPIALWILLVANWNGFLPKNKYMTAMLLVGFAAFFLALFVGHGNIAVALYGARILVIHFPLMFAIGRIFDRQDVFNVGKVIIWIAVPITFLMAMQFYSPQSAWVNRGVGGEGSSGFSGALGYFRPSATFSFGNGTTLFYGLVGCFILYFWIQPKTVNKWVLLAATVCLISAIPLSISRGLFFQVGVSILFAISSVIKNPKFIGRILFAIVGICALFAVLGQLSFFQTSIEAFTSRFETANTDEGGLQGTLVDRFLGGMITALSNSGNQPFFGLGIGMGTNVGSNLLAGTSKFLISEEEWGRLIGEMGPLLGIVAVLVRVGLCFEFIKQAYKKLQRQDFLPWMLVSFGLLTLLQTQWAQPTALGFSTLIGGLIIASFNKRFSSTYHNKP